MRRLLLLVPFLITPLVLAQTDDHAAVVLHVEQLFDAMRASDGDAVRAHFHESLATLYTVSRGDSGYGVVREEGIPQFAQAVSQAPPGLLDERLGPIEVRIDGDFATAFMSYDFYVGERLSHCGVNSFHLLRTAEGWRTIHVTDTRRTTGCGPDQDRVDP